MYHDVSEIPEREKMHHWASSEHLTWPCTSTDLMVYFWKVALILKLFILNSEGTNVKE